MHAGLVASSAREFIKIAGNHGVKHARDILGIVANASIELTRSEIEEFLHHAHWIASKNGTQARFMQAKYPTFTFDKLMRLLIDSKCVVQSRSHNGEPTHFSGWKVRKGIERISIPLGG